MVKYFFSLGLFLVALSAQSIAIVPANINYQNEDLETLSDDLFTFINSAVVTHNSKQKSADFVLKVKNIATPTLKNSKLIAKVHKRAVKNNLTKLLKNKGIDLLLVSDFSSKKALSTIKKCKKVCKISATLALLKGSGSKKTEKITIFYNGKLGVSKVKGLDATLEGLMQ